MIRLYTAATPNGHKVSIALEELGVPYEVRRVHLDREEQLTEEFLALNPNHKIPVLEDDELVIWSGGGGGHGPAIERAPEAVLDDVRDGKVTLAMAAELYGVVIEPDGRGIDEAGTRTRRRGLAKSRIAGQGGFRRDPSDPKAE